LKKNRRSGASLEHSSRPCSPQLATLASTLQMPSRRSETAKKRMMMNMSSLRAMLRSKASSRCRRIYSPWSSPRTRRLSRARMSKTSRFKRRSSATSSSQTSCSRPLVALKVLNHRGKGRKRDRNEGSGAGDRSPLRSRRR